MLGGDARQGQRQEVAAAVRYQHQVGPRPPERLGSVRQPGFRVTGPAGRTDELRGGGHPPQPGTGVRGARGAQGGPVAVVAQFTQGGVSPPGIVEDGDGHPPAQGDAVPAGTGVAQEPDRAVEDGREARARVGQAQPKVPVLRAAPGPPAADLLRETAPMGHAGRFEDGSQGLDLGVPAHLQWPGGGGDGAVPVADLEAGGHETGAVGEGLQQHTQVAGEPQVVVVQVDRVRAAGLGEPAVAGPAGVSVAFRADQPDPRVAAGPVADPVVRVVGAAVRDHQEFPVGDGLGADGVEGVGDGPGPVEGRADHRYPGVTRRCHPGFQSGREGTAVRSRWCPGRSRAPGARPPSRWRGPWTAAGCGRRGREVRRRGG